MNSRSQLHDNIKKVGPETPPVQNHWPQERDIRTHLMGRLFGKAASVPHLKWGQRQKVQGLHRRNHFPSSEGRERAN